MINPEDIKAGCWLKSAGSSTFDIYILEVKGKKARRLYDDGSGSWQSLNYILKSAYGYTRICSKGFSPKEALEKTFKRKEIDNLTYIELLDKVNQNELSK